MIEPKFREIMQQFETSDWKFRMWFNVAPELVTREERADRFDKAGETVERVLNAMIDDNGKSSAEAVLLKTITPEDGLAAYEILHRHGKHGVIGYIDWP